MSSATSLYCGNDWSLPYILKWQTGLQNNTYKVITSTSLLVKKITADRSGRTMQVRNQQAPSTRMFCAALFFIASPYSGSILSERSTKTFTIPWNINPIFSTWIIVKTNLKLSQVSRICLKTLQAWSGVSAWCRISIKKKKTCHIFCCQSIISAGSDRLSIAGRVGWSVQ